MSAMTGVGESALKMRVKRGSERLRAMLSASPEQSS
jgi:RNA polymerase sigma-70 factor (ECF subfamily)